MKVRLVRQDGRKAKGFFEKHGGKVFKVIIQRDGGFDVDLTPLGHPGEWGWMYDNEVKIIDNSPTIFESIAGHMHEVWAGWMEHLFSVGTLNNDGSYTIPPDEVVRWKRQMNTDYQDLSEIEKKSDREQVWGSLGFFFHLKLV